MLWNKEVRGGDWEGEIGSFVELNRIFRVSFIEKESKDLKGVRILIK